ncbi:MAG TPA: hypothetical protein VMB05_06330 [Solirubrobacteraceae bacterium]|nr:hypothetical protein [Solirubrobacteraceae bacterium]
MSKRRESNSLVKSTVGAVPWLTLARAAMIVSRHWNALSAKERAQLAQLIGESRGRASNLSSKQRGELRKLARKLDLKGMGRELWPIVRGGRGGRGRRGRKRR